MDNIVWNRFIPPGVFHLIAGILMFQGYDIISFISGGGVVFISSFLVNIYNERKRDKEMLESYRKLKILVCDIEKELNKMPLLEEETLPTQRVLH